MATTKATSKNKITLQKPTKPTQIEEVVITYDKNDKRQKEFDKEYGEQYAKYNTNLKLYNDSLKQYTKSKQAYDKEIEGTVLYHNTSIKEIKASPHIQQEVKDNFKYHTAKDYPSYKDMGRRKTSANITDYKNLTKSNYGYYSFNDNDWTRRGTIDEVTGDAIKNKNVLPSKMVSRGEQGDLGIFTKPTTEPKHPTKKTLKYDSGYDKFTTKPLWATALKQSKDPDNVIVGDLSGDAYFKTKPVTYKEAKNFPEAVRKKWGIK